MPGARRRGKHARTAWIDNIKSWTGLSVEESIRMTEDRDTGTFSFKNTDYNRPLLLPTRGTLTIITTCTIDRETDNVVR